MEDFEWKHTPVDEIVVTIFLKNNHFKLLSVCTMYNETTGRSDNQTQVVQGVNNKAANVCFLKSTCGIGPTDMKMKINDMA